MRRSNMAMMLAALTATGSLLVPPPAGALLPRTGTFVGKMSESLTPTVQERARLIVRRSKGRTGRYGDLLKSATAGLVFHCGVSESGGQLNGSGTSTLKNVRIPRKGRLRVKDTDAGNALVWTLRFSRTRIRGTVSGTRTDATGTCNTSVSFVARRR